MASHARTHEHHAILALPHRVDELADPVARDVQAAIVDRLHRQPQIAYHGCHGRDLRPPRTAFLAMREHHAIERSGHNVPTLKKWRLMAVNRRMALDEEQSSAAHEMRRAIDVVRDCADLAEVDPETLEA